MSLQTGTNLYVEYYYDLFGLGPDGTIADFRAATNASRAHWLNKMCNGGRCLHRIDWQCGFSISADMHNEADRGWRIFDEKVKACFVSLAGKAPLADTLGKVRLLCGRKYMIFAGNLDDASPSVCVNAGGQWGKKARVFGDEDVYIE
jgi:hypothetical protein